MNNCSVSKIPETFQNDSLSTLNKIVIVLNEDVATSSCYMRIGCKDGIKITSTLGLKMGTTLPTIYDIRINGNGASSFFVVGTKGNTITIESCYNIVLFTMTETLQSNISITGYTSLSFGKCKLLDLNTGSTNKFIGTNELMEYSELLGIDGVSIIDNVVQEFVSKNPTIKLLTQIEATDAAIHKSENLSSLNDLQACTIFSGDITALGTGIRSVNIGFKGVYGTIEQFVAKRVNAGQSSGCVNFTYANASSVTYNNTTLPYSNCYVSWIGNSITISNTAPAEYVAPQTMLEIFQEYIAG